MDNYGRVEQKMMVTFDMIKQGWIFLSRLDSIFQII